MTGIAGNVIEQGIYLHNMQIAQQTIDRECKNIEYGNIGTEDKPLFGYIAGENENQECKGATRYFNLNASMLNASQELNKPAIDRFNITH